MRIRVIITLAVLVVAAGCTSSTATEDAAPVATPTPTPTGPTGAVTVEDATAVNDAWFEAYEAGDVAAMIDLYAPDAELPEEGLTLEDERLFFEWKVAEGTEMLPRNCTASEVEERDAVAVECEYAQQEYLSRAVDGPAVPHTMTMVVGPHGIERLESDFGDPDFNVYTAPFYAWMQAHHPTTPRPSSAVGGTRSRTHNRAANSLRSTPTSGPRGSRTTRRAPGVTPTAKATARDPRMPLRRERRDPKSEARGQSLRPVAAVRNVICERCTSMMAGRSVRTTISGPRSPPIPARHPPRMTAGTPSC